VSLALRLALAYVARGWPVLPLAPRSKVPDGRLAAHGVLDATLDPDLCRAWWAAGERGVGLACGVAFDVLDVDPRNGGDSTLLALVAEHGELPQTPRAITGGGGSHLLLVPVGGARNGAVRGAPGLDWKTRGGYIVAPPSWHPNGVRYEWDPAARPSKVALAQAPAWLQELARPVTAPPRPPVPTSTPIGSTSVLTRAARYLATMEPSISGSGGHLALWAAAKALAVGFELGEDDAMALLSSDFNPRCQPPWSSNALRHKVRDALRDRTSEPGWLLRAPRRP